VEESNLDRAIRRQQIEVQKYTMSLIQRGLFNSREWQENQRIVQNPSARSPQTMAWFLPVFKHIYVGGNFTILRFANHFAQAGVRVHLFFYAVDPISEAEKADFRSAGYQAISHNFPFLQQDNFHFRNFPDLSGLPECDCAFATFWMTAYLLLKFNKTSRKFYFCQDDEEGFYPAGELSALARMTYGFGFDVVANTQGLFDYLQNEFQVRGVAFNPSVDAVFNAVPKRPIARQPRKIFFYARPGADRNGFILGVNLLRHIKEQFEGAEIVAAGAAWDPREYGIEFLLNLGVLSLEETAQLYRTCDYGIVFMFSKHTGYVPLELMASGAIVITNRNRHTSWFYQHKSNCLCVEPLPHVVTLAMSEPESNPALKKQIREGGMNSVAQLTWEAAFQTVDRFVHATSI
jgi:glycosyltransferase involved in cell wall biosynthesis